MRIRSASALVFVLCHATVAHAQATWFEDPPTVPGYGLPWMVYDESLGIPLINGVDGYGIQATGSTWLWTGTAWVNYGAPELNGLNARAAYDSVRNRIVVLGEPQGGAAQTWEFDGIQWAQLPAASPPLPGSMAFDPGRGVVVAFVDNQTWEWDGVNWTQQFPANTPGWRWGDRVVYHAGRQSVLLFGGDDGGFPFGTDLGDLWEWNGVNWTLIAGNGPPRDGAALAYDAGRDRLVVHGGTEGFNDKWDTWEWDGISWSQVATGFTAPGGLHLQNATYDASAGAVLLYGGSNFQAGTWSWDGVGWTDVTPPLIGSTLPIPRNSTAVAFDSARDRVVMYGDAEFYNGWLCDTWELGPSGWSQVTTSTQPPCTALHSMAYDAQRAVTVMLEGAGSTWEYDGVDWTSRGPGPAVSGATMAYDSARGRSVVFGGFAGSQVDNQTYAWDGQSWTVLTTANAPPARWYHTMTYDVARDRVIVHGGEGAAGTTLVDTWEFDGTDWTQVASSGPLLNIGATMTYDVARQRTVLVGGNFVSLAGFVDETWEWDGATWTSRPSDVEGIFNGLTSAYDSNAERVVLIAPDDSQPWSAMEIWYYASPFHASVDPYGAGCAGSAGVPTLDSVPFGLPWIGSQMTLRASALPTTGIGVAPYLAIGVSPLDLDLTPVGAPNCRLLVDPFFFQLLSPTAGVADWSLALPVDPGLAGQVYRAQVLSVDINANPLGIAFSNGVRIEIGVR